MKTNEELKDIAVGMNAGTIFSDRHIQKPEMVPAIFMPLSVMDDKSRKKLVASKPGMLYEYISAAGPLCMSGYPTFATMQILTQEEVKIVFDYMDKIKEAVKKL